LYRGLKSGVSNPRVGNPVTKLAIMNDHKLKIITRAGILLAAITGSIYGLLLTITGYLLDWGPGGSMQGPLWKILLTGILSVLIGTYIGVFLVRKLAKILLAKHFKVLEFTIRSFAIVLLGSMAAFVSSWETGYLLGKITGSIEGLDWMTVLVYTPLMSFIYGIPVSLVAAVLFGVFVFLYLKAGERHQGLHPGGWSPPKSTLKLLILLSLALSCTGRQEKNEKIIESNPNLIGRWTGEGNFFNMSLNTSIGPVPFEILINKDNTVSGKVGEARLTKTSITKTGYGFEIRGILDAKLKKDHDLGRKHLIILLVMPEDNRDSVRYSDANFHLKNNYFFDFAMRVGGVGLTKYDLSIK